MTISPVTAMSSCPGCGTRSGRIDSRYHRRLADLPTSGRLVELVLLARLFSAMLRCAVALVFTERFDPKVLAHWARRTARLDEIVHHLGLALGGRPAAVLACRLMLPVNNDTLLRVVCRRGSPRIVPPTVISVDDWARRRHHRFGPVGSVVVGGACAVGIAAA